MDISVSYYSATGSRENNEDAASIQECRNGLLALVADGLGGHAKGEVASGIAAATINRQLMNKTPDEDALVEAIQMASDEIYKAQEGENRMRTTVAAAWIGDYMGLVANVGDSRIYQFRDGEIIYQSVDHSVAQMAVLVGEMRAEEIRNNPDRNKLIRVLGNEKAPKVDCESISIQRGDRILICSDGFWEPVEESVMAFTSKNSATAKEWLEKMKKVIAYADRPEQDNHTAIAVIIND